MPRHQEVRHLPYTAAQMFDLVADVKSYEDFLPWVVAIRVRSNSETEMIADMIVGFSGLREKFTSRVIKQRPSRIEIDYIEGPLKYLHNHWGFSDDPDGGCRVDFMVDFAFRNSLFDRLAGQMFGTALRRMIDAFETRASELYGKAA